MSTTSAINGSGASATTNPKSQLKVEDFINLMVTQLQNQDPMSPASNSELLQQMSQIGQLQSQQTLQTSLKDLVLQNNIGGASNLIGKRVEGLDSSSGSTIGGTVEGLSVSKGSVVLKLDSGLTLPIANVTSIVSGDPADTSDIAAAVKQSAGAAAEA